MEQNMTPTKKGIALSVCVLSLALALPAFAQPVSEKPMSPSSPPMMEGRGPMHPEFREEMEKMHKEQIDLDVARDKLMDKCIPTPKDQAASCKKEREELRARAEKMREEHKAFREKMEGMRKEHMEQREDRMKNGMGPGGGMMRGAPAPMDAPAK